MSRKTSAVAGGDTARIEQYNNLRDEAYASSMFLCMQQATPNLTLKVSPGSCYINGMRVDYAGGNSPSFTAPTTHPRIDLLTINSAGTLVRNAGVEAASPAEPTCPVDEVPISLIYNKVGQTSIRETDTTGQGYIYKDVRSFLNENFNVTQIPDFLTHSLSIDVSASLHSNESPNHHVTVSFGSDQINGYSDLVFYKQPSRAGYHADLIYIKRDSVNKTPYKKSSAWVNIIQDCKSVTMGVVNTFILGNYVYAFVIDGTNAKEVYRFDKETLANKATITVGAGGNTTDFTKGTFLTDGSFIYIPTTTNDSWNKYSVNGTTLDYVAGVTMDTSFDCKNANWIYNSATTSWIGYGYNAGSARTLWCELTLGSATAKTNTEFIPIGNGGVYDETACVGSGTAMFNVSIFGSVCKRNLKYEMIKTETFGGFSGSTLTTKRLKTNAYFTPIDLPSIS